MFDFLAPDDVRAPFGNYHHGVRVPPGAALVFTSGQLGVSKDDAIDPTVRGQARQCFENIGAILREADMGFADVVRINAYVTAREHFADYMAVRDEYVGEPAPASTLMIVRGFTRPEFLVEVEVVAAKVAPELSTVGAMSVHATVPEAASADLRRPGCAAALPSLARSLLISMVRTTVSWCARPALERNGSARRGDDEYTAAAEHWLGRHG